MCVVMDESMCERDVSFIYLLNTFLELKKYKRYTVESLPLYLPPT